MRILIAGYGNTGRAVDTLIKNSAKTSISSIELCDTKIHGITVQEWIIDKHSKIDTVINLTGEPSENILSLCWKYKLDYIDTGLDMREDDLRAYTKNNLLFYKSNLSIILAKRRVFN